MRQCYKCKFFVHEPADYDTGSPEMVACDAAIIDEDAAEDVPPKLVTLLEERWENMYFMMSELNNCPAFTEERPSRASILSLKGK
jgi:hypothetical protein